MDFAYSEKVNELRKRLSDFMDRYVYPNEQTYKDQIAASGNPFHHPEIVDELKAKLTKFREARKDKEAKLAKAQEDLKKVLSVKQEAAAVLMGLLQ